MVGIGFGAAKMFEDMGLQNSAGHCTDGLGGIPRIIVRDSSVLTESDLPSPIFLFEPQVIDKSEERFHNEHVFGVYLPQRDVEAIAIKADDRKYACISRDGTHILIGVDSSPQNWSEDLRQVIKKIFEPVR